MLVLGNDVILNVADPVWVRLTAKGEEALARSTMFALRLVRPALSGWRRFTLGQIIGVFGGCFASGTQPFIDGQIRLTPPSLESPSGDSSYWEGVCSSCHEPISAPKDACRFEFWGVDNPSAFPAKRFYVNCPRGHKNYIEPVNNERPSRSRSRRRTWAQSDGTVSFLGVVE